MIKKFEDIITWQKAKELCVYNYDVLKKNQDYGFKDQLQRASVSIMNNIAEGYDRFGNKEFRHFLFIAKGSCAEVRSMLILAKELKYFTEAEYVKASSLAEEISKMLSSFIRTIHTNR